MNIKMIVTDLDGTLLRTDKTISDYTRSVLTRCREAGIKTAYATGRGGTDAVMAPGELFDGAITSNGAIARIGDTVVYNRQIPYDVARPFLVSCDKRGLRITSQASPMHYSNFVSSDVWPWLTNFELVDFSRHERDADKIYTFGLTPEDTEFINNHLPESLYMVTTVDGLAMIMHKDATKAKAVAELAQVWGIAQNEITAFGDDLNDIDMLAYAGTGVAMANALEEAKAAANHICGSNDDDGVAKWIEQNAFSL